MHTLTDRLIDQAMILQRHLTQQLVAAAPRIHAAEALEAELAGAGIKAKAIGQVLAEGVSIQVVAHDRRVAVAEAVGRLGHDYAWVMPAAVTGIEPARLTVRVGRIEVLVTIADRGADLAPRAAGLEASA